MPLWCCLPLHFNHRVLLNAASRGLPDLAEETVEQMATAGLAPGPRAYHALAFAYVRSKAPYEALDVAKRAAEEGGWVLLLRQGLCEVTVCVALRASTSQWKGVRLRGFWDGAGGRVQSCGSRCRDTAYRGRRNRKHRPAIMGPAMQHGQREGSCRHRTGDTARISQTTHRPGN
jgi:hypothetical protein